MARGTKIRFVVGLFDAVADLRRAVEALSGSGLTCERLCVLAYGKPAERINHAPEKLPELALEGLSNLVVKLDEAENAARVVPVARQRCGRTAEGSTVAIDPALVAHFPDWVMGRQAKQLEDQLRLGGTLLFVRVTDDFEQTQVGKTLLRHARNGVQTHDIVG